MLTGCARRTSVILTDTVCSPPCWRGIRPGETTSQQAVDLLRSMPDVQRPPETARVIDQRRAWLSWTFTPQVLETGGYVYLLDDLVAEMEFGVHQRLSLGDMVAILGEPDAVSAISAAAETRWLVVVLLYPELGAAVSHVDFKIPWDAEFADVQPGWSVFYVHYFDPMLYDTLLREGRFTHTGAAGALSVKSVQPWQGFVPVQITVGER